ncbi:MAG: hypothetical protein WCV82_00450 [Candidatus Paceibacterota bacterium]
MFNKTKTALLSICTFSLPALVSAQVTLDHVSETGVTVRGAVGGTTLSSIIDIIISYLGQILFLLMALAVVMFVWYVIKYFIRADTDKKEAGSYVMYSLIGFFVILSLWGIINILGNSFNIGNADNTSASWANFKNLMPK